MEALASAPVCANVRTTQRAIDANGRFATRRARTERLAPRETSACVCRTLLDHGVMKSMKIPQFIEISSYLNSKNRSKTSILKKTVEKL